MSDPERIGKYLAWTESAPSLKVFRTEYLEDTLRILNKVLLTIPNSDLSKLAGKIASELENRENKDSEFRVNLYKYHMN